jgi:hypothetical protein
VITAHSLSTSGFSPRTDKASASSRDREPRPGMTREEWIAYRVSRAPKITMRQWAAALLLLRSQHRDNDPDQDRREGDVP